MKIDDALELARRRAAELPDAVCAFISGSVVEGFGNATSDVDLYVVLDGSATPVTEGGLHSVGDARIGLEFGTGITLDLEFWPLETVRSVARLLAVADPLNDHDDAAAWQLTDAQIQLAHRVGVGRPVREPETFRSLAAEFDLRRLADVLAARAQTTYNGHTEDAVGAIGSGDHVAALITSRLALESAVDFVTARLGSTNAKSKWRGARLRALGCEAELAGYLEADLNRSTDPAEMLAAAKARLRYATALVSARMAP